MIGKVKHLRGVTMAGVATLLISSAAWACPKDEATYYCSGKCGDGTPFGPDAICAPDSDTAEVRWADQGGIEFCRDHGGLYFGGYRCTLGSMAEKHSFDEIGDDVSSDAINELME